MKEFIKEVVRGSRADLIEVSRYFREILYEPVNFAWERIDHVGWRKSLHEFAPAPTLSLALGLSVASRTGSIELGAAAGIFTWLACGHKIREDWMLQQGRRWSYF